MKKITIIMMAVLLSTATITACAGNSEQWDYVITVCGGANESCPVFIGKVGKRLHIGFDDPDAFKGTEEEILPEFRKVRDEIMIKMKDFYLSEIKGIKIECHSDNTCNL